MSNFKIDKDNNIEIIKNKKNYTLILNIKEDKKYININIILSEDEYDNLISELVSAKAK